MKSIEKFFSNSIDASKHVLKNQNYLIGLIIGSVLIFVLFTYIPVLLIPGNTLLFQLKEVFIIRDYVLMSVLSVLTALLLVMQVHLYKSAKILQIGKGALGSYSGFVAMIFGTAACASCVASVLGFLGVGTVFFLIKFQWVVASIATFLVVFSLYFTSLKVLEVCNKCQIK